MFLYVIFSVKKYKNKILLQDRFKHFVCVWNLFEWDFSSMSACFYQFACIIL